MADNSDSFTEVTTTGWGSRIGSSIVGAGIGLLLFIASFFVLYWNEGRAVDAITALNAGARSVVAISSERVDAAQDGKLVYLTGTLATSAPLQDATFHVGGPGLVRLHRKVEMFQWKEHSETKTHKEVGGSETKETTYSYTKEWSDSPIDSAKFKRADGHGNPGMPIRSAVYDASAPTIGAFHLDATLVGKLENYKDLSPESSALPTGYVRNGDMLYHGTNPAEPTIGDLRVSFEAVSVGAASVVAAQMGDRLAPFAGERGHEIGLVDAGTVPVTTMFQEAKSAENILTWILRAVGFAMMLIGLWLVASPLATLLGFLPFLEDIAEAGAFVVALLVALPLTCLTIAIAWFAHRPLIGGALLVAAALLAFLMHRVAAARRGTAKRATA